MWSVYSFVLNHPGNSIWYCYSRKELLKLWSDNTSRAPSPTPLPLLLLSVCWNDSPDQSLSSSGRAMKNKKAGICFRSDHLTAQAKEGLDSQLRVWGLKGEIFRVFLLKMLRVVPVSRLALCFQSEAQKFKCEGGHELKRKKGQLRKCSCQSDGLGKPFSFPSIWHAKKQNILQYLGPKANVLSEVFWIDLW